MTVKIPFYVPCSSIPLRVNLLAAVKLGLVLIVMNLTTCYSALQVGFYEGKCGRHNVEAIINDVITKCFIRDPTIVAALLRLQFHDCFVQGCDASILLDGNYTEKTARANHGVRGYNVIDEVKASLEKACPGVVSCTDIIALATRDAIALSGGLSFRYKVLTGRRDSLISLASSVDVPNPSISVSESIAIFEKKGLNVTDMVLLLGGHTVGVTHCSSIQRRLYQNSSEPDLLMDPFLANLLRMRCSPRRSSNHIVELDQNPLSSLIFDNSYYRQIKLNRGILRIDQELAFHPSTSHLVTNLANGFDFASRFGAAMVKMGAIDVLTGAQGEIRTTCRATN